MKSKIRYFAIGGMAALLLGSSLVYASNTQPGSTTDPLVSKSYVDSQIEQILQIVGGPVIQEEAIAPGADTSKIVSEVMRQIEFLYGDKLNQAPSTNQTEAYIPVSASKGQTIIGHEGTEIILRSGKAVAFCIGENGIVDVTEGIEVFNNSEIKGNHVLIIPRLDGRGVTVVEDAWFIIRGGYNIQG